MKTNGFAVLIRTKELSQRKMMTFVEFSTYKKVFRPESLVSRDLRDASDERGASEL